ISPVLANMTLDGLEKLLREKYPTKGPGSVRGKKSKVHMVRYADDFIITGSSQTLLEKEVKPLVIGFLQERGLELSQEKTTITHIADGFDFLGQNIRKYNGLLLTRPSKKNVKAFLKDIRETIKGHKQATAYGLIALLKQIPENLSRKGCAPIIGKPRGVTWSAYIFVVFYSGDHYYADPQTPLSRAGPPHLGDLPQADQGSPCVPPCSSRARRRQRPPPP